MTTKSQIPQQDSGLIQRGLLLLGGMTALVVVVLLIMLRGSDAPKSTSSKPDSRIVPLFIAPAAFPSGPDWPALVQLSEQLPSAPGWQIRYNAAVALARRGSAKTPWPLLLEMLDEDRQQRNFQITLKNGKTIANEEEAQHAVRNALSAIAEWHKKQDAAAPPSIPADLQAVYSQVDRLAQGGNTVLRVQADRTRKNFFRKS